MHELSIVKALIEQVGSEVQRAGHTGRVSRLELTVGRLSGVNADAVRFAFELAAPGTVVEAAELCIAEPKARCACRACGESGEIDALVPECPACGSIDILIEGGHELVLETIDLDE